MGIFDNPAIFKDEDPWLSAPSSQKVWPFGMYPPQTHAI